jgi:hypothetical protein
VGWSFDITLAAVFAIASLAAAMKAVGTIAMCQRMNDAEWGRPSGNRRARQFCRQSIARRLYAAPQCRPHTHRSQRRACPYLVSLRSLNRATGEAGAACGRLASRSVYKLSFKNSYL